MHSTHIFSFLIAFSIYTPCYPSWAHETLQTLSRTEKIGQLIAARIENTILDELESLLTQYKVGALIPLQYWTLDTHAQLIDTVQHHATTIPLLILEDAEWGMNMHIPEIPVFPKAMTLAATHNIALIKQIGHAIGKQCKALGININLAPVLDVNGDAQNPVIGMRAFGDTEQNVTAYAHAYAQGLSEAGIIPCLKHFPGHGRTHTDPHITLPILTNQNEQEILCPFSHLTQKLYCAVMVGHIAYPAFEPDGMIRPATMSYALVTEQLIQRLGHRGLIISDALNMGALSAYGNPGDVAFSALKAGADMLLCPPDVAAVINRIEKALDTGEYTEAELDAHVLKILETKEALGLHRDVADIELASSGQLEDYTYIIQETYDAAATAHNNLASLLPLKNSYQSVTLGSPITPQAPSYQPDTPYQKPLLIYLYPGSYRTHRLQEEIKNTLAAIAINNPGSIVLLFGSPYCLMDVPETLPTLVLYEDTPYTHITAQKILAGTLVPQGQLPITLS